MSRAVAAVAARMAAIAAMVDKGMDRDAATVLLDRAREQAERGGWRNSTGKCPACCKREATPEYRRQARLARDRARRRARRAVGA